MLSLSQVHSYYDKMEVLKGISIDVAEGEIVALIGANGAGKTTTLNAICGVVKVGKGKIRFLDKEISSLPTTEIVKLGISQVPEGRKLFQDMTVLENLEMGSYRRRDKQEIKRDLKHVYEIFPVLFERKKQLAGTLSGGEQQMLAIARGLMMKPRLLLLDEPSLGLAPILVNQIFEIIKKINKLGTTILLVEQNAHMALSIANRGYVMETGKVVLEDLAFNLLKNEMVRKTYLGIA
ncbi:MAG: ABC transporter ATP-binding protein [bacterium]|nr:ABC transporter ATP-binding protein [bacterium]